MSQTSTIKSSAPYVFCHVSVYRRQFSCNSRFGFVNVFSLREIAGLQQLFSFPANSKLLY